MLTIRKALKQLKSCNGRVLRAIRRQLNETLGRALGERGLDTAVPVCGQLRQGPKSRAKIYVLITGMRPGLPWKLKTELWKRIAIEAETAHMKKMAAAHADRSGA